MNQATTQRTLDTRQGLEKRVREAPKLISVPEMNLPDSYLSMTFKSAQDRWAEESIQSSIVEHLERIGYTGFPAYLFAMAVTEAAANAAEHGNKEDPKKDVCIHINLEGRYLYAGIRDRGEGIPREKLEEASRTSPKQAVERSRKTGRGIGLPMIFHNFECSSYKFNGYHIFSIEAPYFRKFQKSES